MRDLIIKNKKILMDIVMVVLALYWFEYRPMRVKQHCMSWAVEKAKSSLGDQTDVRYFFWKCSNDYGI